MPIARGVLIAVASFPAALGPDEFVAAEPAWLLAGWASLAGWCGKRVVGHLRDPLRCRLAVRGMAGRMCWPSWQRSRQWDAVAQTAYARLAPSIPDHPDIGLNREADIAVLCGVAAEPDRCTVVVTPEYWGEPNMTTYGPGGRIRVAANLYFPVIASPAFVFRKLAYLRRIRNSSLDEPTPPVADYVSALHRDGMVIIPEFFDADIVASLSRAVPDEADFEESGEGERSFFYRQAGEVAALSPFFEHPTLRQTACAFISAEAVQLRREVCLKVVQGDILSFEQFPHMDTWKLRMKAFLYLEDVTTENGPTVYYKGSHRGLWRLPMEARIAGWYRTGPRGFSVPEDLYLGCFWPHEVQRLAEAHGYRKTVCTGKAGTLLIFNGRGLHHATPLNSGRRLTLSSYWIHRGEHT